MAVGSSPRTVRKSGLPKRFLESFEAFNHQIKRCTRSVLTDFCGFTLTAAYAAGCISNRAGAFHSPSWLTVSKSFLHPSDQSSFLTWPCISHVIFYKVA